MINGEKKFNKHYDSQTVYQYIVDFKRRFDGNSPSLRQIRDACNISSASVVSLILHDLEMQGLITFIGRGDARGIMITGGQWNISQRVQVYPAVREYPYFWVAKRVLPERWGQGCRILEAYGKYDLLVEFESDRYQLLTKRYFLKKVRQTGPLPGKSNEAERPSARQ